MNHKDVVSGFALFGGTLTAYILLLVFHLYTDQLENLNEIILLENALIWMSQGTFHDRRRLVQVMARYHGASRQWWPRFLCYMATIGQYVSLVCMYQNGQFQAEELSMMRTEFDIHNSFGSMPHSVQENTTISAIRKFEYCDQEHL